MYERFTDRARKVMQLANQEAKRFNHEYVSTEHILLGLVQEGSGVAANVLKNLSIDLSKIRLEVEKVVGPGGEQIDRGEISAAPNGIIQKLCGWVGAQVNTGRPLHTPRVKKVINYAVEESRKLNHNYVGSEHLLLGLLREQEGIAAHVLMNLGINIDGVREEILNLLGSTPEALQPGVTEIYLASDRVFPVSSASLTVYQIELIHERIRQLNEQKETYVAAQDFVQAGRFQAEAEALNKLLELYHWFQGRC
jgi:ATP-dependent Clp protease ATP-binding subunit ClpC